MNELKKFNERFFENITEKINWIEEIEWFDSMGIITTKRIGMTEKSKLIEITLEKSKKRPQYYNGYNVLIRNRDRKTKITSHLFKFGDYLNIKHVDSSGLWVVTQPKQDNLENMVQKIANYINKY